MLKTVSVMMIAMTPSLNASSRLVCMESDFQYQNGIRGPDGYVPNHSESGRVYSRKQGRAAGTACRTRYIALPKVYSVLGESINVRRLKGLGIATTEIVPTKIIDEKQDDVGLVMPVSHTARSKYQEHYKGPMCHRDNLH